MAEVDGGPVLCDGPGCVRGVLRQGALGTLMEKGKRVRVFCEYLEARREADGLRKIKRQAFVGLTPFVDGFELRG